MDHIMKAIESSSSPINHKNKKSNLNKQVKGFVNGGIAGMIATTIIQPIDMIKVRIQLIGERPSNSTSSFSSSSASYNPSKTEKATAKTTANSTTHSTTTNNELKSSSSRIAAAKNTVSSFISSPSSFSRNPFLILTRIIREDSFWGLYKGLSAGLLRQATYTTARMGFFNLFISKANEMNGQGKPVSFSQRAIAGLSAGGLAALIGNPADLALIRMQSDKLQLPHLRSNDKSVIDALSKIIKTKGVLALWTGASPTVMRAMALNLGMLSTYSEAKERLKKNFGESSASNYAASAIAGFCASFLSLPFDYIKTRMQEQKPDANGKLMYNSLMDCFVKVMRGEGPLSFYKGFSTYYFRIAPYAMITLLAADFLAIHF